MALSFFRSDYMALTKTLSERFLLNTKTEDTSHAEEMLKRAEDAILDETNRDVLLDRMKGLQLELAIIYHNRLGDEGSSSRSEGGISVSYDIPKDILTRLSKYRRIKAVGVANASEE